jgi:hypothetical protein
MTDVRQLRWVARTHLGERSAEAEAQR